MIVKAKGFIPIPAHAGDMNPDHFAAIHKDRLERLEQGVELVRQFARQEALDPNEIERWLWGFPCGSCGSAESLCCCAAEQEVS